MARFTPRSRGKDIEPGPDFIDQMRAHQNDPVTDAPFVPCPHSRTDYSHLNDEQLAYYIHWRDELRKGNLLKSD